MIVVYGFCCRWWPVVLGAHLGRCGVCNERPSLDRLFSADDYAAWKAAQ